ncbi:MULTISPECIES: hypothetical protein [unclassified Rhizobium]|uniref:sulfotransferase family protein n=1 Tax=unclassified Rhizobium TaxID=2613769 RepID=UPI001614AA03|nr:MULTISPECIES: hypothetical protein [unclassified Rhizobium]MBB3291035.1 hypothetical protein [Rhizobium sp. BK252]MBB3405831.1 hypothetical protein [Rhizobium sp. BK289]MBB3418379.1 hypothetical protein [Rhizobium sp. BK284]MBB3486257.1 hypothetical protein [Rhizobium sp. BK347]
MSRQSPAVATTAPTLIVVLGMHRSGTSVLTRAMETMGAEFGSSLLPPVAGDNEKGYFEDVDIYQINVEIMQAAGADWHTMAPINLDAIDPQVLNELRVKASATLRAKCEGKIFAVKDPRISRLLPFWQPIFAGLPSRVVYAIAVRNPISVASSLAKRSPFAEEKAYILWLAHVVPALDATLGATRTIINYDALLDAPRAELARVSSELGLQLNEAGIEVFEREFLDGQLRHTRFGAQEVNLVRGAPRQLKVLFAALEASVCGHLLYDDPLLISAIEDARVYLDDIAPLLRYEWRLSATSDELRAANGDLDRKLESSGAALRQVHEQLDSAAENHRAMQSQINTLNQTKSLLENRLADIHAKHVVLENRLADVHAEHVALLSELAESRQSLADVFASTSWRLTSPLRSVKRLFRS